MRRSRSAPTSSTGRCSSRSAPRGTGCSAPCTHGSRSGCSIGSAPLSLVGVEVANTVGDNSMSNFQKIVGGALILGGTGFLARTFIKAASSDAPFHLSTRDKAIAIAIGAFGGFVVGLTSVGSGTFFGLAMLFAYPLTASKMVGTDMFHAAVLLWVAGISHLLHGDVDKHAILWLLTGSIPGVLIGSHLSIRVPEQGLRIGFGVVLLLSGIKLVGVPQANWVIAIMLGAMSVAPRPLAALQRALAAARGPGGGVESPGRGPGALDRVLRRTPGCDCGRVRPHRGREDRAQPDLRDEDRPEALFSPTCNPKHCRYQAVNIDFRLRKKQHIEVWMERNGKPGLDDRRREDVPEGRGDAPVGRHRRRRGDDPPGRDLQAGDPLHRRPPDDHASEPDRARHRPAVGHARPAPACTRTSRPTAIAATTSSACPTC